MDCGGGYCQFCGAEEELGGHRGSYTWEIPHAADCPVAAAQNWLEVNRDK
jgi:hypothetical protein